MLLNCGAGEDSWESLELQGDQISEDSSFNPKRNQLWKFIERTDAEAPILWCWCKEPTHWTHLKRLRCWERLKAKGLGRGWAYWLQPLTSGWLRADFWPLLWSLRLTSLWVISAATICLFAFLYSKGSLLYSRCSSAFMPLKKITLLSEYCSLDRKRVQSASVIII